MKKQKFIPSEEAWEIHRRFQKEKGPSIMGKTCPTLTFLNIDLHQKEGFRFLYRIIGEMVQERRIKLAEDKTISDLAGDSLDEYIQKALEKGEWVDKEIKQYLSDKVWNHLKVEIRNRRRREPLYIKDKKGHEIENPKIKKLDELKKSEDKIHVEQLFQKAGLTEREKRVYYLKKGVGDKGKDIAKRLGVSQKTVNRDYAEAKKKLFK